VHLDEAGVLFDDPEANSKTQARAFARRFGGKKGFKQVRFYFFIHPCAGVSNCYHPVSYTHLDVYKRQGLTIEEQTNATVAVR